VYDYELVVIYEPPAVWVSREVDRQGWVIYTVRCAECGFVGSSSLNCVAQDVRRTHRRDH
jgi:hypothetical protein